MTERNKLMKKTKRGSHIARIVEISLKTGAIILEGAAIACISTGIGYTRWNYPWFIRYSCIGVNISNTKND